MSSDEKGGMSVAEFVALALGAPVLDDHDDACIAIAKPGDRITVAYGDDDGRIFTARFDAFRLAAPGVPQWDGRRWAAA